MIRRLFQTPWFQYAFLVSALCALYVYFAYFFESGFGYTFDWSVLYTENETYGEVLGLMLIEGLKLTVAISLISAALALVLGTIFGLARLSAFKPVYYTATAYVEFFRNTPLLVQLFFWYFALPMGLPEGLRRAIYDVNFTFWTMKVSFEFITATVGLAIYTSSFMAEIIRAGIQAIPKGLLEASYSSGLTYPQTLRKVILPLAFRSIIPPLGSEFLNNMKNSSLAMVVGVAELCWSSQQIKALTFKGFEATSAATIIYLCLSLLISGFLNLVNNRLKIVPRKERTFQQRFAHAFFAPLDMVTTGVSQTWRLVFKPRPVGLILTPMQAARKRFFKALKRGGGLSLKGLFLAGLAYLVFLLYQGLASLDYTVIADNFRSLLIWRFPVDEETEFMWGLGGLAFSILMAVIAIGVSFFIGLVIGVWRTSENRIFQIPSLLYIELIRGNPLIMVIFWIYFFLPIVIGADLNVFWSATIAMTVFTGAYIAEIVRGGIQNIPKGQFEAAYSTGLTHFQTLRRIILPQVLKQMIPAIVGQFIAIFKDTSLAYIIGVFELTYVGKVIANRLMVHPFEIYTTVAMLYFICCYIMSLVANRLEKRLSTERFRLTM